MNTNFLDQPGDEESDVESSMRDWRDPSKPRNPEDDVIIDRWRRREDRIFGRVNIEEKNEYERFSLPEDD